LHSRTHARTHPRTHAPTHSPTHAPTHSRTHARTHLLTYPPAHSLARSIVRSIVCLQTGSGRQSDVKHARGGWAVCSGGFKCHQRRRYETAFVQYCPCTATTPCHVTTACFQQCTGAECDTAQHHATIAPSHRQPDTQAFACSPLSAHLSIRLFALVGSHNIHTLALVGTPNTHTHALLSARLTPLLLLEHIAFTHSLLSSHPTLTHSLLSSRPTLIHTRSCRHTQALAFVGTHNIRSCRHTQHSHTRCCRHAGRCPGLLPVEAFRAGTYRIRFEVAEYFEATGREAFYPYCEIAFIVR
jgi:hypothetical protein